MTGCALLDGPTTPLVFSAATARARFVVPHFLGLRRSRLRELGLCDNLSQVCDAMTDMIHYSSRIEIQPVVLGEGSCWMKHPSAALLLCVHAIVYADQDYRSDRIQYCANIGMAAGVTSVQMQSRNKLDAESLLFIHTQATQMLVSRGWPEKDADRMAKALLQEEKSVYNPDAPLQGNGLSSFAEARAENARQRCLTLFANQLLN